MRELRNILLVAVHAVRQAFGMYGPCTVWGILICMNILLARQGQTGILIPAFLSSQNWDMQGCATEGCSHKAEGGAC